MIDAPPLLTIVLMAGTTCLTRIPGYVVLCNRTLGPHMQAVMESVPGCVPIAVIAPAFVSGRPADLAALGLTGLAACRLAIRPACCAIFSAVASRLMTGALRTPHSLCT